MSEELLRADKMIPLDKQGYLKNLGDWNPAVAEIIAARENIILTDRHWEVINLLRDFYEVHSLSPMMRIIVKEMKGKFGDEKGNSMYLLSLFPEYPALIASKIAGLPRPTNCP